MHALRTAFFVSALVALLTPLPARADDPFTGLPFRSLGPAVSGGRLGAVAGSDLDPALYYAGAAGGGVWKTTNAGTTWTPVFDGQDVQAIGAITVDPVHPATVWVGTGEASPRNDVTQGDGVYRSDDGAKTWQHVLPLQNSSICRIVVDPRDTRRVVVAVLGDPFADSDERGIYRTVDGGTTWQKTLYTGPASGASDVVADPSNPDVLYAGIWQYRRTGWSSQSGGNDDGLYRSKDGGATWTPLRGHGLPDGPLGRIGLAVSRANPLRVYALIESQHGLLWRSDDAGATWSERSDDTVIDERPFYYTTIFADPIDADRVWTESVHMTVSTDGGSHFSITGRGSHGDHHGMWISNDGRRIIEANDGGVAFSFDGGTSWDWRKSLPISQLYRVAASAGDPYRVCAGLQDNGMWCGPSNPLSARGTNASQWLAVGGGDGTWVIPDPHNARYIWQSAGGQNFAGEVSVHDMVTGETREVGPYMRDQNVVPPKDLRYRFNWETPIAFDPFDPALVYTAGNVVFATRDRGMTWAVRSGDLTRNDPAHETMTGGLTLDGTGAETSDTILSIEPSRAARGEIWIGTDDGYIQLTRDGGAHWTNVTPDGIAPFGRFATISASSRDARVAYAVYDAHMTGDRTPYVFATHDFGAHWSRIDRGLPAGDEARSVFADPAVPHLLYVGLERSLWISWNEGAAWMRLSDGLPAVSIRDIRASLSGNDLLLATHGRGAYILDDRTPLQLYPAAVAAGIFLFPVRDAVEWTLDDGFGTRTDAPAPDYGAVITYYMSSPAQAKPSADIVDANGRVVRHLDGLANAAGFNRIAWDLTGEDVDPWTFAPDWNQRSFDSGAPALPGRYTVRLHLAGRTLQQSFVVRSDPRLEYTPAQTLARHAQIEELVGDLSSVDRALNVLSTIATEAPRRANALHGDAALSSDVEALGTAASVLIASISSNPKNDQDNDFLVDVLRERLQSELDTYFDSQAPPTREQRREDAALHALTSERLAACRAFDARIGAVDARVIAAHLPSLRTSTKP